MSYSLSSKISVLTVNDLIELIKTHSGAGAPAAGQTSPIGAGSPGQVVTPPPVNHSVPELGKDYTTAAHFFGPGYPANPDSEAAKYGTTVSLLKREIWEGDPAKKFWRV